MIKWRATESTLLPTETVKMPPSVFHSHLSPKTVQEGQSCTAARYYCSEKDQAVVFIDPLRRRDKSFHSICTGIFNLNPSGGRHARITCGNPTLGPGANPCTGRWTDTTVPGWLLLSPGCTVHFDIHVSKKGRLFPKEI